MGQQYDAMLAAAFEAMTPERRAELQKAAEVIAAITDMSRAELAHLIWLSMPGSPLDPLANAELAIVAGDDAVPDDWTASVARSVARNASHAAAPAPAIPF